MVLPAQVERGIFGEHVARLGNATILGERKARHDQRLRAGSTFDKPAFNQKDVSPLLCHQAVC
ncbi:hypothetical protein AA105894_0717 [Asaia spathodeae NBRC 105894]|nr:hypothetical protein AA105894_0717 [Asaia spathodeae NBRC 105894]